ncbi:MAG TPA: protein-export chaperone SecB [Tenuifilaceae bacterium]|nr:protein-export chaperone SecB [Tenuifilaceae bacterium]
MNKKLEQFKFSLENFIIRESHITRNPVKQGKFEFSITPHGGIEHSKSLFTLHLVIDLKDDNNSFSAKIHAIGIFKFSQTTPEATLDNFFYTNAPAIIFPYIRAYISALTSLSGLQTINLPVMNLTPLGKTLKENTKTI